MNVIVSIVLLYCVYLEFQGLKACVQADAEMGIMRSMFNMAVLFGTAVYILYLGQCVESVLQFR